MTFTSTLQPSVLRAMASFLSQDESRIVINGVFIEYTDRKLTVVATDGRRLAIHRPDWDVDKGKNAKFIIPPSILSALPSGVAHPAWKLEWDESTSKLVLTGSDYSITTRSVDGNYPDWRGVVPDPMPTRFPSDIATVLNSAFLNECVKLLHKIEDAGENTAIEPVRANNPAAPLIFHGMRTTLLLMPMKHLE